MEMKAIDISHHNGTADFKKVKAAGIDGVFIRTGYGKFLQSQIDKKFYDNYDKAKSAGLNVGAYHYSYAHSPAEAVKEAEAMIKIIGDRKFELPLFFDIEEKSQEKLSKKICSDMVRAFCNRLESAGYWAGVYSYDAFFGTNIAENIVQRYSAWVARVENVKPKICKRYDIWQFSWKGKVDGIKGDVDMNIIYKDFPQIIARKGLNGYSGL